MFTFKRIEKTEMFWQQRQDITVRFERHDNERPLVLREKVA